MACGACSAANSPTFQQQSLAVGTIPQGSVSTMTVFWIQASFPNAPCSSPHQIRCEWREPGVTNWALITSSSKVKLVGGTASASIGPFPSTHSCTISFPTPGTFETRAARIVCGPAFVSSAFSYTVPAPAGKRFLRTGASTL